MNPLVSVGNIFQQFATYVSAPSVNIFYKALIAVGILAILSMIEETEKFAQWAAISLLVLLLLQSNGNGPSNITPVNGVTGASFQSPVAGGV